MRLVNPLLASAAIGTLFLSACEREPIEHRLSAEQLAWQGFHEGEELRFGCAQAGYTRTYRVTKLQDQMEKEYVGYNFMPVAPPDIRCQHINVTVQRTDSVGASQVALHLGLYSLEGSKPILRAEAEWESFYGIYLPIDSVSKGAPIDTLQYRGIELLAGATFGPSAYTQVLHVSNQPPYQIAAGQRPVQDFYYAKNKGVVAFREAGTGLWYRLP